MAGFWGDGVWDDDFSNPQYWQGTEQQKPPAKLKPGAGAYYNQSFWDNEYFANQYWGDPLVGPLDSGVDEEYIPHGKPEKKRRGRKSRVNVRSVPHARPYHGRVAVATVTEAPRVFGPWIDLDQRDEERYQRARELVADLLERTKRKSEEELFLVMTIAALADEQPSEDEEQVALEFMKALALLA